MIFHPKSTKTNEVAHYMDDLIHLQRYLDIYKIRLQTLIGNLQNRRDVNR